MKRYLCLAAILAALFLLAACGGNPPAGSPSEGMSSSVGSSEGESSSSEPEPSTPEEAGEGEDGAQLNPSTPWVEPEGGIFPNEKIYPEGDTPVTQQEREAFFSYLEQSLTDDQHGGMLCGQDYIHIWAMDMDQVDQVIRSYNGPTGRVQCELADYSMAQLKTIVGELQESEIAPNILAAELTLDNRVMVTVQGEENEAAVNAFLERYPEKSAVATFLLTPTPPGQNPNT